MIKILVSAIAILMSLVQIYWGAFGVSDPFHQRIIHLLFGLVLVFLTSRLKINGLSKNAALAIDWLLVAFVIISLGYLLVNLDYVSYERIAFITPVLKTEKVLGIVLILLILEGTRRFTGMALPALTVAALVYPFAGPYLPGIFKHGGYDFERIIDVVYLSPQGVFGLPLAVSATYVALYIIFGAFLNESGLGKFFINFSQAFVGYRVGGPAKVAIIGSGFMGMLTGTATGNVVTTGTFTIPLMKSIGYRPYYAGAVEAIASTGGIIMPPVMGSVAFIMSEITGVSYGKIIIHAFIPAVLYYLSLYFMVHFEAVKTGLKGLSKDQLPDGKQILMHSWHLTIPILVLLYYLIRQYTASTAVIYSLLSLVIVANFRRSTRMGLKKLLKALEAGARGTLVVIMAVASAGIIVGMINLTGLGVRLTSSIVEIAGGNLYLALILSAISAVVMGMGLPSVVAYLILAGLVAPSLIQIGVPMVAAHFFIIYFSITAFFTPPFCTAAYAAAGIAGSPIMKTGFTAVRLGSACYIIPFMFVFGPALLALGGIFEILIAFTTSVMGIFLLAITAEGHYKVAMSWSDRIISSVGALFLIKPGAITDVIGFACFAAIIFIHKRKWKKIRAA